MSNIAKQQTADSIGAAGPEILAPPTTTYDTLPICIRSYQVPPEKKPFLGKSNAAAVSDKWYLVFDTETTTNIQTVRFGVCHIYRDNVRYTSILFPNNAILTAADKKVIKDGAGVTGHQVMSIEDFRRKIFIPYVFTYKAMVIGFNLPYDLSMIALHATPIKSGSMKDGFRFFYADNDDTPCIEIKHINVRASMYKIQYPQSEHNIHYKRIRGNIERIDPASLDPDTAAADSSSTASSEDEHSGYDVKYRGRFVDCSQLANVIFSRKFSLDKLCKTLDIENKKEKNEGHGLALTPDYVAYAIRDVVATWECFVALRERYARYGLTKTAIDSLFTEASLGKGTFREMNIQSFMTLNTDFSPEMVGRVMSTFYGGRSEIKERRMLARGLYCDMTSMYPTNCTLMGLWKYVIAREIAYKDVTDKMKKFLGSLLPIETGLSILNNKKVWKDFVCIVRISPDDDVLPIRANYDDETTANNIGLNYLKSDSDLWYTLPDVIDSILQTGKVPQVQEVIQFIPKGVQQGLQPLALLGKPEYTIDPGKEDFVKRIIELRKIVQGKMSAEKTLATTAADSGDLKAAAYHTQKAAEYEIEQQQIKITANATTYGIFAELIAETFETIQTVAVHSHIALERKTVHKEKAGIYFNPILATCITGGSRLMLGIAEKLSLVQGLSWSFCDTDSMFISDSGNVYNDAELIDRCKTIVSWFNAINPYDFEVLEGDAPTDLFKFEKYNFTAVQDPITGKKHQVMLPLYAYCISAKRYVVWHENKGYRDIKKASVHGLGTYLPPYVGYKKHDDCTAGEVAGITEADVSLAADENDLLVQWVCVSPFRHQVPPISVKDLSEIGIGRWEYDIWHIILDCELTGKEFTPELYLQFTTPVRHQYTNSSPHILAYYGLYNGGKDYQQQVKPFSFYVASSPCKDRDEVDKADYRVSSEDEYKRIIDTATSMGGVTTKGLSPLKYASLDKKIKRKRGASFTDFASKLADILHNKKLLNVDCCYREIQKLKENSLAAVRMRTGIFMYHPIALYDAAATPDNQIWFDRDTGDSVPRDCLKTYGEFLQDYNSHAECKFSNGGTGSKGVTQRRYVYASEIIVTGKEFYRGELNMITQGSVDVGVLYEDKKSKDEREANQQQLRSDMTPYIARYGVTAIAKEVDMLKSTLSMVATGKRAMSLDVQEKIERYLTSQQKRVY